MPEKLESKTVGFCPFTEAYPRWCDTAPCRDCPVFREAMTRLNDEAYLKGARENKKVAEYNRHISADHAKLESRHEHHEYHPSPQD